MRIGIATFHFAHNYGAMIQAYALQEYLENLGHEVYMVDYRPEYHTKRFVRELGWKHLNLIPVVLKPLYMLRFLLINNARKERFDNFEKFLNTRLNLWPYKKGDDLHELDALFLGSDQIWNQGLTDNRFDELYYGLNVKCRVIAYAASSRYKTLTEIQKKEFADAMKGMHAIGVREQNLQKLLQPLTEKNVSLTIDPTLLVNKSAFDKLDLQRPVKEEYVLTYEITEHQQLLDMAKRYAHTHKLKMISLSGEAPLKPNGNYDYAASPEKFLAYIKHAKCVFTSSFHGTALSLVFNTQFYSYQQHNDADIRLQSILNQVGAEDRFIDHFDKITDDELNYEVVNHALNTIRSDSKNYIYKALKDLI